MKRWEIVNKKLSDRGDPLSRWAGRIEPRWRTAFLSAFLVGLAAHLYKLTNTLYCHDSLYSIYSSVDMVSIGRWFLAAACWPSSKFDLPWFSGLLALCWIGLTAAVVADLFDLKRPAPLILTGGLLAAFPVVTNTFFYGYLCDGFMLSMLLAALAARLDRVGDRVHWHIPVSALLICLSCGIYQAYVSFALLLSMSHFILELLDKKRDIRDCRRWIARQFIVYGAGLAAYYLIWKLRMALGHIAASGYQGVGDAGWIGFAGLAAALGKSARTLAAFFLGGNVFRYGWTLYAGLNALFLLLLAGLLVFAAVKSGQGKKPERLALLLLSLASLPVFACLWFFVSKSVSYHNMMLQSLCVPYILALALSERFTGPRSRACAALFFAAVTFRFAVQANIAYFELDRCNQTSRSTAEEMLTRIHLQDEGQVERIAFTGGGDSSLVAAKAEGVEEILVLAHQLRPTLLYDHTHASLYFVHVMGCPYEPLSEEELAALEAGGQTEDMPAWPQKGSVRVVGDTAVVCLPEPEGGEP